jgi:hypothetical protein
MHRVMGKNGLIGPNGNLLSHYTSPEKMMQQHKIG